MNELTDEDKAMLVLLRNDLREIALSYVARSPEVTIEVVCNVRFCAVDDSPLTSEVSFWVDEEDLPFKEDVEIY